MAEMTTKQFIETTFIHQVGELVQTMPYIAFMTMGIGIEFMGKCLNAGNWHEEGVSRKRFEEAINNLASFSNYRHLIGKQSQFDLYGSLRCGLAHAAAPKFPLTLSSKKEMANLTVHSNNQRVNLRCEDFYADFKAAWEELFLMGSPVAEKLGQPFLFVPDYENGNLVGSTPITHSLAK